MKLTTRILAGLSAPGMLLVGFGVFCLLAWRSAGPASADAPTNMDWPFYGNDPANTRFQNVDLINPSNVAKLRPAWVFHTNNHDNMASLEVSPIVVNGIMYI